MRATISNSSYAKGRAPIRPELLAAKLASIRNYDHPELMDEIAERPRLLEMLWFLQFMSLQAGGLLKFCEDMIKEMPDRFGTEHIRAAKPGELSLASKMKIYSEIPDRFRPAESELDYRAKNLMEADMAAFLGEDAPKPKMTNEECSLLSKQTRPWTLKSLREGCQAAALEILPEYLEALCTQKEKGFKPRQMVSMDGMGLRSETWFIDDPIAAVMDMMDAQATKEQHRLATTEVTKAVFDTLDYSWVSKKMVRVTGNTRFGKTESLKVWVGMRPGLARLVNVPRDNSMASLYKKVGEALGIDCSYGSNTSRLKERVEYVIQHSGLFFILDEAHFLIPVNITATTTPHRLNWVRTEIVDRGLPLALSVTPQAFDGAVNRFVKKTHYDMAQFFGREFLHCQLPEVLNEADMIAVAAIHFPEMGKNALGFIASEARISRNYLQAVEAIACRARYLAQKEGIAVGMKHIKTAVFEVLHSTRGVENQPPEDSSYQNDRSMSTNPADARHVKEPFSAYA